MCLTRLTPIDGEAILPLAECKEHLRVTHAQEDALIGALRDASIAHVERSSGVILASADFRWTMRHFPSRIDVTVRPVTEITGVKYHDAAGTELVYPDARLVGGSIVAAAASRWPTAYGYVAVEFTAGLSSPDDVPDLLSAVKLMLTHLYQNRGAAQTAEVFEIPLGVKSLIKYNRRRTL